MEKNCDTNNHIAGVGGTHPSDPGTSPKERRRTRPRGRLAMVASILSSVVIAIFGFGVFCYLSDGPVRLGRYAIYSQRGHAGRIDYSGNLWLQPKPVQTWKIWQRKMELSVSRRTLSTILKPEIYPIGVLVITKD
jgi:hypothetical protein